MNKSLPIISLSLLLGATALAADWESMKRRPAQIEVLNMNPVPLVAGTDKRGWARVPDILTKNNAVIYMPKDKHQGVADFKVLADGYLILACNYDYQGNKGGTWDDEDWDARKFKTKGWSEIGKNALGSPLVSGENRQQVLFSKQVRKGETYRLRCNKYDPPFPILLGSK